ncbi:MAG: hypothetical protein AB1465_03655 [Patescibacteria group bacterium]
MKRMSFLGALIVCLVWFCSCSQEKEKIPDNEFFKMYSTQEEKECVYSLWKFLDSFELQSAERIENPSVSEVFDESVQKGWGEVVRATREYLESKGFVLGLPQNISQSFVWTSTGSETFEIYQVLLPVYYSKEEKIEFNGEIDVVKTGEQVFVVSNLYTQSDGQVERIDQIIYDSEVKSTCQAVAQVEDIIKFETTTKALEPENEKNIQTLTFPVIVEEEDTLTCKICKGMHDFLTTYGCNWFAKIKVCTELVITEIILTAGLDPTDPLAVLIVGGGCTMIVSSLCDIISGGVLDSGFDCTIVLQNVAYGQLFHDVCVSDYAACIPEEDDPMSLCMSACECNKLALSEVLCQAIEARLSYKYGLEFTALGESICEFPLEKAEDCESYCQAHLDDFELDKLTQKCSDGKCIYPENCNSCPIDCTPCPAGQFCVNLLLSGYSSGTCPVFSPIPPPEGWQCPEYACLGDGFDWCEDGKCAPLEIGTNCKDCPEVKDETLTFYCSEENLKAKQLCIKSSKNCLIKDEDIVYIQERYSKYLPYNECMTCNLLVHKCWEWGEEKIECFDIYASDEEFQLELVFSNGSIFQTQSLSGRGGKYWEESIKGVNSNGDVCLMYSSGGYAAAGPAGFSSLGFCYKDYCCSEYYEPCHENPKGDKCEECKKSTCTIPEELLFSLCIDNWYQLKECNLSIR